MWGKTIPAWATVLGAAALSAAMVTAFTDASTGARTVTASVVTDANAYLALAVNSNSPYDGFVSVSGAGKATLTFDGNNADAAGDGINPDGAYEFDSILKVTNAGTDTRSVDLAFGGTDASLCQAALTSAEDQSGSTYGADPSPVSLAKDATAFLGVKVLGTGKTSGQSVACTITVTAS